MKIIKILFNSIVAFIIIFILTNIFLSYFWELKTNYKINKMNPYTDTVLMFLGLNSQEGLQLYKETWINRKYDYDQFTEYAEHKTLNNKYLNISSENGRKILNNKNCTRNFFFYGSSVTFGYNVTDEQTHPSYFKKILDENHTQSYCVYNYGRAGYDSTRENILFLKHLLNKKIKKRDFIFFIDGGAEEGNKDGINTQFLRRAQRIISQKYWDMYKHTFPFLIESLPVFQLVTRAKQKFNWNEDDQNTIISDEEILHVFQINVNIRKAICEELELNCFSFLHPFSLLHGKYFSKYEKSGAIETEMLKIGSDISEIINRKKKSFQNLKKAKNIIDISPALNKTSEISYVDRGHFSPNANKNIAKFIYFLIKEKIE